MRFDAARRLFKEVDRNRDGKIDENEFNQFVGGDTGDVITGSTSTIIPGDYTTVPSGVDYGTDTVYRTGPRYGSSTDVLFDQMDTNRDGRIDRHELNQYIGGESVTDASTVATYVSRYPTDSRGFYLDPNPEIITRRATGPVQTYTQRIIIRYLQPPPLPPSGENVIKEVRPPPLEAPAPFVIREPGKAAYQPPPLILRERPPTPPPPIRPIVKTVMLPPLPAPPRSTIIEKLPDLPDRPRDIILERWLPYGPRAPARTVRIPAAGGLLPRAPRNQIIRFEAVPAHVVRQFRRLIVTRADPELYIRQYGSSLLEPGTFLQHARSAGVAEDLSLPASGLSGLTTIAYDHAENWLHSYLGDTGEHVHGHIDYPTTTVSDGAYSRFKTLGHVHTDVGFDVHGHPVHTHDHTGDITYTSTGAGGFIEQRL